jgi:ferredoxin-NADP reductase
MLHHRLFPLNLDFIELTIKQEGLVSGLVHRQMSAGASLTASSPMGTFGFDGSGVEAIVLIVGGVTRLRAHRDGLVR